MGLKTGEFTDKDIKSVTKVVTVLKYLNQGRELKLGDYTYKIGETHNEGFSLLFKVMVSSTDDPTEREEWHGYQGDLMHFSGMCTKLTIDELTVMQANMALQGIKLTNRR